MEPRRAVGGADGLRVAGEGHLPRLPRAPAHLSYKNKVERRRIHKVVYGDSWWVDLDAIEAEAAEIMETDPANAERFFGNRVVAGSDAWLPAGLWEAASAEHLVAQPA
jgi:hypothetical protein